jgi:hypothetical protein
MTTEKGGSLWHVYVRKGTAFVPDVARTEAGFFLDVEPVRVARLDDLGVLASALEEVMAAGNPRVPTPTRAAFPKPVIVRPAGVKNWNAFVDRGACFTISRTEGEIAIAETGRNDDGEWVDAPSLTQRLPASSSALAIAKRIAERARQRADLT